MNQEKKNNNDDKGFKISDRRYTSMSDDEKKKKEIIIDKEKAKEEDQLAKESKEEPLPEINFSNFILSLSTSVLLSLGEIPDPISKEKNEDLDMAKQTIDILGVIEEKTRGNLTKEEESLMENLLSDLRMRYVKKKG